MALPRRFTTHAVDMRYRSKSWILCTVCLVLVVLIHLTYHPPPKEDTPLSLQCVRHFDKLVNESYTVFSPPKPLDNLPRFCSSLLRPRFTEAAESFQQRLACYLRTQFSFQDRNVVHRHLRRINYVFRQAAVDLVLDSGSLLGARRNHGMIPYDVSISFRIRREQKKEARRLFHHLCTRYGGCEFEDTEEVNQHWKLHMGCRRFKPEELKPHSIPICLVQADIYFFWTSGDHVKILEPPYNFTKEIYFPLISRPFEGILFDTVNDIPRYLQRTYGKNSETECRSYDYTKKPRPGCTKQGVDCAFLEPFRPFVRRFLLPNGQTVDFHVYNGSLNAVFFDSSTVKRTMQ